MQGNRIQNSTFATPEKNLARTYTGPESGSPDWFDIRMETADPGHRIPLFAGMSERMRSSCADMLWDAKEVGGEGVCLGCKIVLVSSIMLGSMAVVAITSFTERNARRYVAAMESAGSETRVLTPGFHGGPRPAS